MSRLRVVSCFRVTLRASTAALIALVLVGAWRADTVKDFFVNGTAENVAPPTLGFHPTECPNPGDICPFSGTMMVDVTSSTAHPFGIVTAYDIRFPDVAVFDNCCTRQSEGGSDSSWGADSRNNTNDLLVLDFDTTPTLGSLVGFEGGPIIGSSVDTPNGTAAFYVFEGQDGSGGRITPVPEPPSLALLGAGLLPVVGVIRRRYLNR